MERAADHSGSIFTAAGVARGARRAAPVALFVIPFGVAFGVAAGQAGVPFDIAAAMSASVFAGASQFAVLDMWSAEVPLLPLALLTLAVNARMVLISAAAHLWVKGLPWRVRLSVAALLSDTGYAAVSDGGRRDAGALLGGGLALWTAWVLGTLIGLALGADIGDPRPWGLDVVILALFSATLAGGWRGAASAAPWGVAALTAVLAAQALPGSWHIIIGGVAGGLTGAFFGPAPSAAS